jgi:hypothetical protein
MTRRKVFISYRRDDAAGFSHAIHDRLVEHLPREQVFMDVHGIEPGADFVRRLESVVDSCDVLLALIGRRWAGESETGSERIHDPHDWVRIEIGTAIRRGVRVIPVLLDGASMPPAESLPEELRPLVRMNAADVRTTRLDADVWDLTGSTVVALGGKWPPAEPGGKIYALLAGFYALGAGAVLIFVLLVGMFVNEVPLASILGTLIFIFNAALVLRLPVLQWIRTLSRQRALTIGSIVHLIGFAVTSVGATEIEPVIVFFFGIIPATMLFLASFAMKRVVRS